MVVIDDGGHAFGGCWRVGRGWGASGRIDLFEQAQGEACQQGGVLGAVAFADAGAIVGEVYVEAPVQRVLDAPVAADTFAQPLAPTRQGSRLVR